MLGVVQLETGLVQEARKVGQNHFFQSRFLFSEPVVRAYLDFRISSPTASRCPVHTHILIVPTFGPTE